MNIKVNKDIQRDSEFIYAGDYEVVGPDPSLGHKEVAQIGASMIFIHYHHRHEFEGGHNKGLWGTVCHEPDSHPDWDELDKTIDSARKNFSHVAIYPVGWAHMVPEALGETILDISPDVISDWVCQMVGRYWKKISLFPIYYEMNVFELFFKKTHRQEYNFKIKSHIVESLILSYEKVLREHGEEAAAKLTPGTFVELTQSSFYWMSEGALLELPRGSVLTEAPLSPIDLINIATRLDNDKGIERYLPVMRQLLHQVVFWNADDSGADNTVADDIRRLAKAGVFYDEESNPEGFVHTLIAGWDAQPQNTYKYMLDIMVPGLKVPSCGECLEKNHIEFIEYINNGTTPEYIKKAIVGFVLDDIFKCTKQTGITSAVYPTESIKNALRVGKEPIFLSDIGQVYKELIKNNLTFANKKIEMSHN